MTSGRRVGRREFFRAAGAAGLASFAGCAGANADPSISVPTAALTDATVGIEVTGLEPHDSVTLRATARSRDGTEWAAFADFEADDDGTVSVPEQSPLGGSYDRADPMGLFWSMRPVDAATDEPLPPGELFVPPEGEYDVRLTAERAGESVAEATTTRRLSDPDIERRPVEPAGLVGEAFVPPGDGAVPGVVHLHGAGGRPHRATGRLLASRGVAALTVRYFGDAEPIPNTLAEIPVEYVERATAWLRERERVDASAVGLFGFSRGGSLALLAATRIDGVAAVVGWVPSGVVWEGLGHGRTPAGTSAWSADGEPVPFLELADADPGPPPAPGLPYYEPALSNAGDGELEAASIPVETADAPVFLVSATDDRRWPSASLAERVVDRLDANDDAPRYRHDSHDGAGHYLRLPHLPTAGVARDQYNVYGGTPAANARAAASAWSETLSFLQGALGSGR